MSFIYANPREHDKSAFGAAGAALFKWCLMLARNLFGIASRRGNDKLSLSF